MHQDVNLLVHTVSKKPLCCAAPDIPVPALLLSGISSPGTGCPGL